RVNGHAPAAVPAEIQVVMTDEALFADGDTPAWVTGHGPIPAQLAKRWLAMPETEVFLRRVFARPGDQQLVGMESRRLVFPGSYCSLVVLRYDTFRTPYCE